MKNLYRQEWVESNRDMGCQCDGYSLHLSKEDAAEFIGAYWDNMPDNAPQTYSRPEGVPQLIEVDEEIYTKISKSKFGVRFWER
ncbi:MAG: hypothetical protein PHZ07_00275 [Patescibacteria group bacterium]|nr:hypothetical protein [Patescibacteria group bacterium]MDD4304162.1 hypothetical protein [Patescibacteria group bacterium]MDD4695193.1 hypothetical protein [Patescibacteria group bacterium]